MNFTYQQAAIGICRDLTDPDAQSIPIAILLVGDLPAGGRVAVIVGTHPRGFMDDPLSRAVLSDIPNLLRRHVETAWDDLRHAGSLPALFESLRDGLRNTLHVQRILPIQQVDLPGSTHLLVDTSEITKIANDELRKAIGTARETNPSRDGRPPLNDVPATVVWPLRVSENAADSRQ